MHGNERAEGGVIARAEKLSLIGGVASEDERVAILEDEGVICEAGAVVRRLAKENGKPVPELRQGGEVLSVLEAAIEAREDHQSAAAGRFGGEDANSDKVEVGEFERDELGELDFPIVKVLRPPIAGWLLSGCMTKSQSS
eukprot:5041087-Pleurochrysis_carterae.AAC.4